jgi:hypothetical protein
MGTYPHIDLEYLGQHKTCVSFTKIKSQHQRKIVNLVAKLYNEECL